jgi:error-prone DNA polymerase
MSDFAELVARSCFSFLEGASHPEELVARAKEQGLFALGLCDRDGLYGSVRAHAEAKKLGQRLLVGADLTLELEPISERSARGKVPLGAPRLALLVEDHAGYEALCHHLTVSHADHEKGEAALSPEELATRPEGLFALLPIHTREDAEAPWVSPLREAFGERFAFVTYRAFDGRDGERTRAVLDAAARFGAPIVASARPLYHRPEQKPLADILHCIRHKTTLDRAGKSLSPNAEAFLRSPAQMAAIFRDHPEWVRATVPVAERCRFSLAELRYHFPSDFMLRPRDDGRLETPDEALRRATYEGARERYPEGLPEATHAQLEKELALIARIGVAPYFLSVQEIVQIAREKRILCQGRGSAANSAVCFVLGVTAVDPARSNLLFERFLSEERAEPPDIDVDFEHERREEVIQALYARYGRDRAAMVSEIIAYRGRSALREVGKVLGLSPEALGKLAAVVTHYALADLSSERIAELGLDLADARLRMTLELAKKLEGFPRHLSIHVGGFVLSAEPLDARRPRRARAHGAAPWSPGTRTISTTLGFFKVDVLGLGMLTAIRKTLELVHDQRREAPAPNSFELSIPSTRWPASRPRIRRSTTPSASARHGRRLPDREPRADVHAAAPASAPFYDLVIEVAIVRPGPIQGGMVHPYLAPPHGRRRPRRRPTRASTASCVVRSAYRSSRSRSCRSPWWARATARARRISCAATWPRGAATAASSVTATNSSRASPSEASPPPSARSSTAGAGLR